MSIKVSHLTRQFGEQFAVNDISFEANKGQILGFLGPNGAGKTTTMKMITGFLPITSGTVEINGYNIADQPIEAKRLIGYLPENNPLYKDMYVTEYLLTFAKLCDVPHAAKTVDRLIQQTGLTQERNKLIGSLSKGYRQRVGLSQALLHDPSVLILDEPTSGLDPNQLAEIRSLIQTIGKEKTLIFSTHIMQEVQALCDRVIIIHHGKLVADGPISELTAQTKKQTKVNIELKESVPISELATIEHVDEVVPSGKNRYTLKSNHGIDFRDQLFTICVKNNWIIREMKMESTNVEDVFSLLTRSN